MGKSIDLTRDRIQCLKSFLPPQILLFMILIKLVYKENTIIDPSALVYCELRLRHNFTNKGPVNGAFRNSFLVRKGERSMFLNLFLVTLLRYLLQSSGLSQNLDYTILFFSSKPVDRYLKLVFGL